MEQEDITVRIVRKKIRSIRLHVTPEGEVICSASPWASEKAVQAFINSKKDWIEKTVKRIKASSQNAKELRKDGEAALAGLSSEDRVRKETNYVYSKAWKEAAMKNFEHTVCRFMPCFEVGLIPAFELKARSMHSMWGNCTPGRAKITLNWELFNYPQCCIDYVVLHEMTHFLYFHHDKDFYGFISRFMPEYKTYRKMMR